MHWAHHTLGISRPPSLSPIGQGDATSSTRVSLSSPTRKGRYTPYGAKLFIYTDGRHPICRREREHRLYIGGTHALHSLEGRSLSPLEDWEKTARSPLRRKMEGEKDISPLIKEHDTLSPADRLSLTCIEEGAPVSSVQKRGLSPSRIRLGVWLRSRLASDPCGFETKPDGKSRTRSTCLSGFQLRPGSKPKIVPRWTWTQ